MAREHGTSVQPWGTLEELLLVCAVNRHGTKSWDSVAMEVQNQSSSSAALLRLTAENCRDKFDDLKRRFVSKNNSQMADELRRLRVEELRREVRRRDVSIVSLELKVKRLTEDRERSLKDEEAALPNKDLQRGGENQQDDSPEKRAVKAISGDDLDSDSASGSRENRSFNESNSTSQRGETKGNGVVEAKQSEAEKEAGPKRNDRDPIRTGKRSEMDRDCSVNGKVTDDEDEENNKNDYKGGDKMDASRLGESKELGESMGESKRGVASKQNSDIQSSASLTKRRRRGGGGRGGEGGGGSRSRSSSGEEAEGDEVSPATREGGKLKLVKHEPLIKVLSIIRLHRLGSVFERRLRSQESERYKTLIRQHMDLHEVESRLNKGVYTKSIHNFFRDLLLLFNNALVFFRKTSPEHLAAQELRSIVLKKMHDQLTPKPSKVPSKVLEPKVIPKIESDSSVKPSKVPIIVCGLRSSSSNAKGNEKKKVNDFVKMEEKGIRKRRTAQERTSGKNAAKTTGHEYGGNELSSHDGLEVVKMEKKENVTRKQGAVRTFLNRMKQNSPSTKGREADSDVSVDESKDSMMEDDDKKKRKTKTKTRGRKKPDERKERVTRSSSGRGGRGGGRRDEESSGRGRRGVGRPPKRPESAGAGSGKRGRDNGEADQVGSAGRPRKRTRR